MKSLRCRLNGRGTDWRSSPIRFTPRPADSCIEFLEERAHHQAAATTPAPAQNTANARCAATPDELFVIEKYTGFNRFRRRYRAARIHSEASDQRNVAVVERAVPMGRETATRENSGVRAETNNENTVERWGKSYCPYCGVGCGLLARIKDGTVHKIKGDPDHPSSLGDLCLKAVYLPEILRTPDRLLYPQIRSCQEGPVQARFMGQAMTYLARRFREIIAEHGPMRWLFMAQAS